MQQTSVVDPVWGLVNHRTLGNGAVGLWDNLKRKRSTKGKVTCDFAAALRLADTYDPLEAPGLHGQRYRILKGAPLLPDDPFVRAAGTEARWPQPYPRPVSKPWVRD